MSGVDFLADTNILLYVLEGEKSIYPFVNSTFAVSVISEIELLGYYKISGREILAIKSLLNDCFVIELLPSVKEKAIEIKQKQKIKLPDAIIAATALHLNVPLLTADKDFSKIKGLDVLLLQR